MFKIKNILLTTDFSELSLSAAGHAIELAKLNGAQIHLLHVLEKTPPILTIRSLDVSEEKIRESIDKDALERLNDALLKIKDDRINFIPAIRKGNDYEEINRYCEENKVDLIVIATHGRTGLLHTLIGSVAEKVVRYSKCPVLVIKPE